MVFVFAVIFHGLMEMEGQKHSCATGGYWVMVVMSTLGFGDITFQSDVGRLFSVVVPLSGSVFMLILLPFMFIQFFYVPWLDVQAAARAPRELPLKTSGHVILTGLSPVERSLVRMLERKTPRWWSRYRETRPIPISLFTVREHAEKTLGGPASPPSNKGRGVSRDT
jgi:hypothetical protein